MGFHSSGVRVAKPRTQSVQIPHGNEKHAPLAITYNTSVDYIRFATNKKNKPILDLFFFGTPMGNRTPDSAVRGRRLNRLTMRAFRIFDNQPALYYCCKAL